MTDLGLSQWLAKFYLQCFDHILVILAAWRWLLECDWKVANKMLPTSVKVQDPLLNKSYTGKNITRLLPSVLLRVCSTSNNATGNKRVIFFRYIWYKHDFETRVTLQHFMISFIAWGDPRNKAIKDQFNWNPTNTKLPNRVKEGGGGGEGEIFVLN